jgi:DNA-binding NarL/FixJ family response regulator
MRHKAAEDRPHRVLIAHSHRILLESLQAILATRGYHVTGAAPNGRRAVLLAAQRRPDVAVLGATMPVMGGLDAAREILREAPDTAVLLLSGHQEPGIVPEGLRLGIRGFIGDSQGVDDLLQAIRDVSQGAIYVSPLYSRTVRAAFAEPGARDTSRLTRRELEMLGLIADGKTMKQAALVAGISTRTAECHRAHIMRKLGIHDTAGLVRYAIRQGLVVA